MPRRRPPHHHGVVLVGSALLLCLTGCASPARGTIAPPATTSPSASQEPTATADPVVEPGPYPWDVPPGEDRACPPPVDPQLTEPAASRGDYLVVIGDSLTRETRRGRPGRIAGIITDRLTAQGWQTLVVCYGGKSLPWGQEQVALLEERGWLGRSVVLALGTNDLLLDHVDGSEFARRGAAILDQLGDDPQRHVWWVDLWADLDAAAVLHADDPKYGDMTGIAQANTAIRRECAKHPQCTVVSWNRVMTSLTAKQRRTIVDPDQRGGIHLTPAGSALRADLIADAVGVPGAGQPGLASSDDASG